VLYLLPEDARLVLDGRLDIEEVSTRMTAPTAMGMAGATRVSYCLVPPVGALVYDEEVGGRWVSGR
jgi:hypothetical protein